MKLNLLQRIVLILYAAAFAYFSVLHVPFKTRSSGKIEYDTLLSDKSNADVSRLFLILLVLTVLAGILFVLLKNLTFKPVSISLSKPLQYSIISVAAIIVILSIILFYRHKNALKAKLDKEQYRDSTTIIETVTPNSNKSTMAGQFLKDINCTPENALKQFNAHMSFNFPDWKIYDNPVVKENGDCVYEIRFTTKDPHYEVFGKEIRIVRISFNYDYSKYYFQPIRGNIY